MHSNNLAILGSGGKVVVSIVTYELLIATTNEERSGGTVDWPFTLHKFSLNKIKWK